MADGAPGAPAPSSNPAHAAATAAPGASPRTATIPDFDDHLANDLVTVQDVGEAWAGSQPAFNDDLAAREIFHRYYRRLADHLLGKDPGFRHHFWPDGSGITLFQDQINVFRNPLPGASPRGRADGILFRSDRLAITAHEFIEGAQLRNCVNMIFDVGLTCCQLFAPAADSPEGGAPTAAETEETLDFLEAELNRIEGYFRRAALRRAQVRYARGMLIGAIWVYLVAGLVWGAAQIDDLDARIEILPLGLGIAVAGCTGAVVSVMQRMTRSKLDIDYTMGSTVGTLGMFRPLIGAIFATAAFLLIRAEFVPHVEVPDGDTTSYFFLALAFVTGFSERLAQDMLTTTEKAIGGIGRDEEGARAEKDEGPRPGVVRG